jgi:hypothetical protein
MHESTLPLQNPDYTMACGAAKPVVERITAFLVALHHEKLLTIICTKRMFQTIV